MSDMRMPGKPAPGGMPPGMPQGAGAGAGGAPGAGRLSPMNGADRAYMQSRGMNGEMTIKDAIEKVYGVPITAPVSALKAAASKMMKGSTAMGKAQQMGGQRPPQAPGAGMSQRPAMPPQAPPARPQAQQGGGLGAMLGKIQ